MGKDAFVSGGKAIRGDLIKSAITGLEILGIALSQAIIEYLESHGNLLDKEHSYTLKEIELELAKIFGEDAARLVSERISRNIKAL